MIKKQHFVALVTSLVLVLSGCETTDLVTDGFSATEEENTVIELVGPNGKSGSIKLPTSDGQENPEDTESEDSESSESETEDSESVDSETENENGTENQNEEESGEPETESGDTEKTDGQNETDDAGSPSTNVKDNGEENSSQASDQETGDEKQGESEDDGKTEETQESKEDETSSGSDDKSDEKTDEGKDDEKSDDVSDKKDDSVTEDEKTEEAQEPQESQDEKSDETQESKEDETSSGSDGKSDEKTDEDKTDEKSDDVSDKKDDSVTEEEKTEEQNETTDETDTKQEEKTEETEKNDTAPVDEKTEQESGDKTEEETVPEKDFSENNKVLMQKVEAARLAAIDAGASSVAPTVWTATEAIYKTEKAAVDTGTKADLASVLNDLIARYNGLENLAQAKDLKDEIDENNFASFRQATYDAGSKILSDLTNPLSVVQSGADFNKQAATAESDFRLVLRTAYNSLAQNERTAAYEAKLKADSVKAYVSRKDDYTKAVTLYRNGELRRSVDPKVANESYRMSKEQFMTLFTEISAARAQAQKEIDEAKKRVEQSASAAEQADVEAPLGNEPVEGIEAEDAKLLEDDDFSDAGEAAVIEAPEAD